MFPYLSLALVFIYTIVLTGITHLHTFIICITWTVYIYWAHVAMMARWMIFGGIVGQIGCSWFPKHVVVALADSISYRIEPYIDFFGAFSWVVLFDIPSAVELSVCMGVACCGWTIYSRVTLIGSPDLEL